MKIWSIKRTGEVDFDEAEQFVVIADTERQGPL
jgi:hypothetical protein